ncbi:chorismate mutase [Arthrobacter sp. AL08]|uniref:chorismate mutase n=1 Tax=Micrococcaceae TaxID=1268 RepID=UPI001CFF8B26|nr:MULTISPECIES: chorismate mutase [Micrococcaceae]MCB5282477.1 Isochorismate pyruvate lyase [Arthrobacter sp. ES1]MDI3242273.1 chorismate mutase [Arthrobacter sp. AL05]MDI3278283.1 chorismate mutase [Arthrobacter sp. AL08]MDJ0351575.1 chorismate mutase [Pseudarthrobacter sp. PH31-O2]WGZ81371.1 chorismate mutase [Arthrobacter sp. EM1]
MDMSTNHENDKAAKADREQLAAVRVAVDEVDEQIVSLIGRRERLIRIAGTLKADSAEVRAPGRVERVIEHVRTTAQQKDIDVDLIEKTYRAMVDAFITLELEVYKASS